MRTIHCGQERDSETDMSLVGGASLVDRITEGPVR